MGGPRGSPATAPVYAEQPASSRHCPRSVTSIRGPGIYCTSIRRSSSGSLASAIASRAGARACTIGRPAAAGSTLISPSITTRAWRTSKCWPTIGPSAWARFSGRAVVSRARGPGAPGPVRQRLRLSLPQFSRDVPRPARRSPVHPTLYPTHEWQGRALHPNRAARVGLRQALLCVSRRADLLPGWLEHYNCARPHSGLAGCPPITRLADGNNLVRRHS